MNINLVAINNSKNISHRLEAISLGNNRVPIDIMRIVMSFLNFQNHLALYATSHNLMHISSLIISAIPSQKVLELNKKNRLPIIFDVSDKDIDFLNRFSIKNLYLNRTTLSDRGLSRLSGLIFLENLSLSGHDCIPRNGLMLISRHLTSLKSLSMHACPLTDEGLAQLSHLHFLNSFTISSCHLASKKKVLHFDPEEYHFTNEGIKSLNKLPSLQTLVIQNELFDNDLLKHFVGFTSLKRLTLKSCLITNEGLSRLSNLSSLEKLNLDGDNLTHAGIQKNLSSLVALGIVHYQKQAPNGSKWNSVLHCYTSLP